ncbi:antibiotic biosynthesis monooxygenase [Nocardioides eburneiflavus]|uniref:Antibiotic biosynthesis monooxygenase n=1 Tax=Nocardioides eburneiflavus TaxID=2518372 RepID=A0A4Z1CEI1_9ACTN|nr:putative quinol monooxygenase [Nocardioides eburneiflavus]TGN63738.1 antibiotic biosynthesis monooxygenase [Nocardioides eburneiflavus]
MSDPVVLYAEFTARTEQLAEVERLITGLADDVRQEPGNLEFTVYQRAEDPCRFFVLERYADPSAFEAHLSAPYGAVFNAALGDLIVEDGSQLSFLHPTAPATVV